jgi:hypothetical protein
MSLHLRQYLTRSKLPMWSARLDEHGQVKSKRTWYTNTQADVDELLYWMGRGADHEAGCYCAGGRRAQSSKAVRCAAIVSHEVAVMMSKSLQDSEKKASKTR